MADVSRAGRVGDPWRSLISGGMRPWMFTGSRHFLEQSRRFGYLGTECLPLHLRAWRTQNPATRGAPHLLPGRGGGNPPRWLLSSGG